MATIRKRGDKYHVQVRLTGRPALTKTLPTKKAAKQWARAQEGRLEEGRKITDKRLHQAVAFYQEAKDLSKYDRTALDYFVAEIGANAKLRDLAKEDFFRVRMGLQRVRKKNGEPLANATINRRMHRMSACLTFAMNELGWIDTNPARIPALPENNERSDEEALLPTQHLRRLLCACQESDQAALYPMVITAMLSGARAGELLELRWKDIRLEEGIAFVRKSKNGGKRAIPIRGQAAELLRELKTKRPVAHLDESDHVFLNSNGGHPFRYRVYWAKAKEAAGITNYRFHDLRHWAASQMAMSGVTEIEAMKVLGHRSAQMTKRYSHLFAAHVAQIGDKLAEKL